MWFDQDLSIENGGLTMKKLGKNRRNRSLQGFYCVFSSIIQAIWLMSVGLPGIKIRSVVLKMLILGRSIYILYIIIYICWLYICKFSCNQVWSSWLPGLAAGRVQDAFWLLCGICLHLIYQSWVMMRFQSWYIKSLEYVETASNLNQEPHEQVTFQKQTSIIVFSTLWRHEDALGWIIFIFIFIFIIGWWTFRPDPFSNGV